jgi:hypothetical protein
MNIGYDDLAFASAQGLFGSKGRGFCQNIISCVFSLLTSRFFSSFHVAHKGKTSQICYFNVLLVETHKFS